MLRNILDYFSQSPNPNAPPAPPMAANNSQSGAPAAAPSFWTGEKGLLGPRNLSIIGSGMLAAGSGNSAVDAGETAAAAYDKKKNLDTLAAHIKDSPALKDPATRQIVQDMINNGMVKEALEMVKVKAPEPYTTKPGDIRYGANNEILSDRSGEKNLSDELASKRLTLNTLNTMPVNQRAYIYAKAAAMGYTDPNEVTELLLNHKSLSDMAKAKGFDLKTAPPAIYPTTQGALTQIQKRSQAIAELDKLSSTITEWTAPYAKQFAGYSIKAMADTVNGKNIEAVSKYLAAKGMGLDLAGLRGKVLSAPMSEGLMHELVDAAMGNIKFPRVLVGSELYTRTQNHIDKAIRDSANAANKIGIDPIRDAQQQNVDENVTPGNAQYTPQQLAQFSQDAIAAGKDPEAVKQLMMQLSGGQS